MKEINQYHNITEARDQWKKKIKNMLKCIERMWLIRAFEDKARELFMKDMIRGATHVYVGEEAIAVGVCAALKEQTISPAPIGAWSLPGKRRGSKLDDGRIVGARETVIAKEKAVQCILPISTRVSWVPMVLSGGGIGLATGAAFACKYRNDGGVAVCFFGDGAINQGVFYESANMAALWKLPIIYVCERNKFAEFSYSEWYFPDQDLTKRTEPFGFKGIEVDGNDLLAVYQLGD